MQLLRGKENVYNLLANHFSVKVSLATAAIENLTRCYGIERMVVTDLYVVSSLNLGAALTHDNHARASGLSVTKFDTEEFWVRVSTVF